MKKYLLIIVAVLGILFMPSAKAKIELPEVTDHEKVTVYLFRGEGCGHCLDFLNYFSKVFRDYEDYFEIVAYESWKNEDNSNLLLKVKEEFGEEPKTSVPFIVVGKDFSTIGFGSETGEEVIEAALKAYQDNGYLDLVKAIAEKNKIKPKAETFEEAATSEGVRVPTEKKGGLSDGVVIGIIFGVLILGFGGLVVYSRKK